MAGEVRLKHEAIAATLSAEIKSGRLKTGAQLPGEVTLARRFQVSRNTVRAALSELDSQGLITTRTGKGSFVLFDGRPLDSRSGWARAMAAGGAKISVRTISLRLGSDVDLAAELGLESPDVLEIERVRLLKSGRAVSYERSVIPAVRELRDIPGTGLVNGSITETLQSAGLYPMHGEQQIRSRRLTAEEAALLDRPPTESILDVVRTSFDQSGRFVERVSSLLDPGLFEIRVPFQLDY